MQGPQLPLMALLRRRLRAAGRGLPLCPGEGGHKAPVRMLQPGAANNVKPVCAVLPIFV